MSWWTPVARVLLIDLARSLLRKALSDRAPGKHSEPGLQAEIIGGAEVPREVGMHVTIDRFADTPMGTFGRLTMEGFACYTVERPWAGNAPEVSCIPDGTYPLRLRNSPIVHRASGGEFSKGWEICDVPGRSLIMLHPANEYRELQGCLAPGRGLGWVNGVWAVTSSRDAFGELMRLLPQDQEHTITIRRSIP